LRKLVRFRQHNLVQDPVPPLGEEPFDLILCRNVLIYFDPPSVEHVIVSLEGALRREGTLLLGAADTLSGSAMRLATGRAKAPEPTPTRTQAQALRRPLGREQDLLERALRAADTGRSEEALSLVAKLLRQDALNADAYFVRGMVELDEGDARAAVQSFRRALYVDPQFGLAAFKLGVAYDAVGDRQAGQRTFEQALRTLAPEEGRHERLLAQVDLGDIAAACRARLAGAA
jgi:Tfp pilus assembly protein PilF